MKEYDYYGAYDVKQHQDYKYNELLGQDYTFDFPPHHDIVSISNIVNKSYFKKRQGSIVLVQSSELLYFVLGKIQDFYETMST